MVTAAKAPRRRGARCSAKLGAGLQRTAPPIVLDVENLADAGHQTRDAAEHVLRDRHLDHLVLLVRRETFHQMDHRKHDRQRGYFSSSDDRRA